MNLVLLLLGIFAGVAVIATLSRRFSGSSDPRRLQQLQRWLIPLVGLLLVLSVVKFYAG